MSTKSDKILKIVYCVIFHGTRQVSPDFYPFHNFWKEKSGLPYPHNQTFWYNFTFFDYMSTYLCLRIIMYLVKYKCVENCKTRPAH